MLTITQSTVSTVLLESNRNSVVSSAFNQEHRARQRPTRDLAIRLTVKIHFNIGRSYQDLSDGLNPKIKKKKTKIPR